MNTREMICNRENIRLRCLLYNAIDMLEEQYSKPIILKELGMTEKEYNKIMTMGD